jgi:hypothetical protein
MVGDKGLGRMQIEHGGRRFRKRYSRAGCSAATRTIGSKRQAEDGIRVASNQTIEK